MENKLFRDCLSVIPRDQKHAFELNFAIADKICEALKSLSMTQHDLALKLGKSDAEISKWLTGRHNFTVKTIASIEVALSQSLITV